MKKLLTTQDIREKYDPDKIISDIESSYEMNKDKLKLVLTNKNSPLISYSKDPQLSFLDIKSSKKNHLVHEISGMLKDTIYFLGLSKKERTKVSQKMRGFYTDIINNYLERINVMLEDPEILTPKHFQDPTQKHRGKDSVFNILKLIQKDLIDEKKYMEQLPRTGYLTGLQVSMGRFFMKLQVLGMLQKDQITLVQQLFDDFNVDWEEGDRENIKLSLQNPAIEYLQKTKQDIQKIPSYLFSRSLNDQLVNNLIEQSIILKKRSRRF